MDISCPKCEAVYRVDIQVTDQPLGLRCKNCGHVFSVSRPRAMSAPIELASEPATSRRVTGQIDSDLQRMAQEEAALRNASAEHSAQISDDAFLDKSTDLNDIFEQATAEVPVAEDEPNQEEAAPATIQKSDLGLPKVVVLSTLIIAICVAALNLGAEFIIGYIPALEGPLVELQKDISQLTRWIGAQAEALTNNAVE